jgi:chloramphenicol-sensitive protein RarD
MPQPNANLTTRHGLYAGAGAFFIWGLFPLLMLPLQAIAAPRIAACRGITGCLTLLALLGWRSQLAEVWRTCMNSRLLARLCLSALLLTGNWTLYAWGVTHHQVVLTSLGYFINPLVNVLLGVAVLSERLNRAQWITVALACAAVVGLTLDAGQPPWIALALAGAFSLYGLVRKTTPVSPMTGLTIETLVMLPPATAYIWFTRQPGEWQMQPVAVLITLGLSGLASVIPLTLFNFSAQRINYTTVGMLQYIAPTLQFITGLTIYHEALSPARLGCFVVIWLALTLYAADALLRSRNQLG